MVPQERNSASFSQQEPRQKKALSQSQVDVKWSPKNQQTASNFQELLAACSIKRDLETGKHVHAEAVKCGHHSNTYVATALINMYSKCGSMVEAHQVFDGIKHPDVVAWTALILGYAGNGQPHCSLNLFTRMIIDGPEPNFVTFVAALKACISLTVFSNWAECRDRGKALHILAVETGCSPHIYLESTLVDMYAKCGSMVDARAVFDSMKHVNVVSWTALILGYANNGQALSALHLFTRMRTEGTAPNSVTFVAVLKACTFLSVETGASRWVECGKALHILCTEVNGCNSHIYVQSSLVDMYAKCASMEDAQEVFDDMKCPDVVSWNVLILGYADNGREHTALQLFTRMKTERRAPDSVTFMSALKACTALAEKSGAECRDRGKALHDLAVENSCDSQIYVQSTLIDMYAKCGSITEAREVFDHMKHLDVVSWNVLISGYADNGQGHTALDLFIRMKKEGPAPDSVTFLAALNACRSVGALEFGRAIHSELDRGNNLSLVLVNCLVDFYSKCGSLVEAQSVFDLNASTRDIKTWTALLAGFSSCGDKEAVFQLFEEMQDAGFRPDGITFLCILTCCNYAGLVEKGKECFDTMFTKYGIVPTIEHYNCMVDMFGRADKLDDAMALLERMPCGPDDATWMALLGYCRKWKNMDVWKLLLNGQVMNHRK